MLESKNSLPAEPQLRPGLEKTRDMGDMLHPSTSLNDGRMMEKQEARNGQFHRSFPPRQVHIISLGSNIGSGVFSATGQALASGGPGNMVLADGMVCSAVWAVLQSLSEITIVFPVSGNYIDYADLWVDPALAFGAAWSAIVASEADFFNVLVLYWAEGSLPLGATVTIFLAVCLSVFLLPTGSASFFTNWGIIAFTNWHFHCAPKAQKDILFSETYGWKSTFWSSTPAWLMLVSLMLLVCCLGCGVKPVARKDKIAPVDMTPLLIGWPHIYRGELSPVHTRALGNHRLYARLQSHFQNAVERPKNSGLHHR
ncbi:proline-specific permease [Aspergillus flavus]|nr:proline-specific permease [Aspergillus flavus]